MSERPKYQLFDALHPEEFAALEADILKRGVMVAVEEDTDGNVLDGHNRKAIADKHGLEYPTVVRDFVTDAEKREHVRKLNFARRHMAPWQWGKAFKEMLEEKGVKRGQGSSAEKRHGQSETVSDLASDLGVDDRTARNRLASADAFDALPVDKQEQVRTREKPLTQAVREAKQDKAKAAISEVPAITGKYRVLYADPPWHYGNAGLTEYGHAESHYPTMPTPDLCELPIKDIAEDNAVLFLWVTSPLLEDAFDVIKAWGFKYKTSFVWDKVKHNFGHYNSVRHEFLLVATRGSCTPDEKKLFDSVQEIERSSKHSEKPEQFREIIETLYTSGSKVELFARNEVKGWKTWGNQLMN